MPTQHFIIGTAGHIDHGKSTLVQTLTGTNPDRLPEEKERGVTIELGFAHFSLPGKGNDTFELGVVDVPGHADFVNNMVAGVGSIDLALFIVAADDSWMPQSEEHLQILTYLGIKNFIVVLTKADLAEDLDFVVEMLADDLQGTALAEAPILPVSAHTGQGMDDLRAKIAAILKRTEPPRDFGQARLAIDRAFSPKGIGTVVTGTLTSGKIDLGDTLTAFPADLKGHVRSIQNHSSSLQTAVPGMRTALNLPDLPLKSKGKKGIGRGHLLVAGDPGPSTLELDVLITRSPRPIPGQKGTQRPLRTNQKIYVHHGSGRTQARLLFAEANLLAPGQEALAQLRFETPIHALVGEHLVLRELSGEATLAGAQVLDPAPSRRHFRSNRQQTFLTERLAAPNDLQNLLKTHLERDLFVPLPDLSRALPYTEAQIKAALKKLTKSQAATILQNGKAAASYQGWKTITKTATRLVQDYHKSNPDEKGLPVSDLEIRLASSEPLQGISLSPDLFQALLTWLAEDKFNVAENLVAHHDHSLELPAELVAPAAEILQQLAVDPLNPPLPTDLKKSPSHESAYRFLTRTKQILPLDAKVTLSVDAYQAACQTIANHITENGPTTASDLRQLLGTSRKIIMPLLERTDKEHLTLRQGDHRTLHPAYLRKNPAEE